MVNLSIFYNTFTLVAIAVGKHLFPFRTEPLSPSAPMVLPRKRGGRVGRRQGAFLVGNQLRLIPFFIRMVLSKKFNF